MNAVGLNTGLEQVNGHEMGPLVGIVVTERAGIGNQRGIERLSHGEGEGLGSVGIQVLPHQGSRGGC
ncbi:hypothetical protein ES703_71078 [subsurface metagenome]